MKREGSIKVSETQTYLAQNFLLIVVVEKAKNHVSQTGIWAKWCFLSEELDNVAVSLKIYNLETQLVIRS